DFAGFGALELCGKDSAISTGDDRCALGPGFESDQGQRLVVRELNQRGRAGHEIPLALLRHEAEVACPRLVWDGHLSLSGEGKGKSPGMRPIVTSSEVEKTWQVLLL